MASLQEGAIFAGRYRILRCIAAGGMGEVYEVIHLETERRRALKVMHAHILGSDDLRDRFKREARIAAHIESEFIVDVFDAGVDEATQMPFMVMELLRGEELGKRVKRGGPLSPVEVVTYLGQAARALNKTHKASIVHRDLKPENLFLTDREEGPATIKVLDFGIAKLLVQEAPADATQAFGTPLYMAPEQFNPRARITSAADIFSLGMVAFTLLVGKSYWDAERKAGLYALTAVAMLGPKEPATARAAAMGVWLPPSFDAWFAQVTALEPEHRFETAVDAVRALAEALGLAEAGRASAPSSVRGTMEAVGQEPRSSRAAPARSTAPLSAPGALPTVASPTLPYGGNRNGGNVRAPVPDEVSPPTWPTAPTAPTWPTSPTALGASMTAPTPPAGRGRGALFGGALALGIGVIGVVTFAALRAGREQEPPNQAAAAPAASSAATGGAPASAPPVVVAPSEGSVPGAADSPSASAAAAAAPAPTASAAGEQAAGPHTSAPQGSSAPGGSAQASAKPLVTAAPRPQKKRYTRD